MSNDKKVARLFNLFVQVGKMVMDGTRDAVLVADYMQRILDPSLPPVEPVGRFTEKDGIIRFKLTAPGLTGPEWEKFCDENDHNLSNDVRKFLNSPDFKPTPAGTIIHVAVLKGELFEENLRTTKNVCVKALKMKFKKANHDLACIIRKEFTNKEIEEMGLWLISGMSDPVDVSGSGQVLLGVHRDDCAPWFNAFYGKPHNLWIRESVFAFEDQEAARSK